MSEKTMVRKRAFKILLPIVAVLLAAALAVGALLLIFKSEETVITLDGTGMSEDVYRYYLSAYKYDFLNKHKEEGLSDTERSWNSQAKDSDLSWCELFEEEFRTALIRKITAASIFDRSYSISASSRKEIAERYDLAVSLAGGKSAANKLLADMGCDVEDMRAAMIIDYKCAMLSEILYGTNGSELSSAVLDEAYNESYARVKTVFVRTKAREGDKEMTEEELSRAESWIAQIEAYMSNGMDEEEFLSVQEKFNEDTSATSYPDGYYLSEYTLYDASVIEAALSMEVGSFKLVRGEYGAFLIYRYPLKNRAYADTNNTSWFTGFAQRVAEAEYEKLIDRHAAKVECDEEVLDRYSVIDAVYHYEIVY